MAIFKITTTVGTQMSIDSNRVSRVIEQGSFRAIWVGHGNLASTHTQQIAAKDSFAKIQKDSGLTAITKVKFIGTDKVLVGANLISRITDYNVLSGNPYRTIWFGPGDLVGINGSNINTDETIATLYKKFPNVVKVTESISSKAFGVTSRYVSTVKANGIGAAIKMGSGAIGVNSSQLLVKESVSKLKSLGIG